MTDEKELTSKLRHNLKGNLRKLRLIFEEFEEANEEGITEDLKVKYIGDFEETLRNVQSDWEVYKTT